MPLVKISYKATSAKFNFEKYKQSIDNYVSDKQIQAIKEWVKGAVSETPTYTGTARGTYVPLGRIVRATVRKGIIKGNAARASRKKEFRYKGKTWPLGFEQGADYAEHKIYKRRVKQNIFFYFTFDHKLPYVIWNNTRKAPGWLHLIDPTPWKALMVAEAAYKKVINKARLPSLLRFLTFSQIKSK